MCGIVGLFNCQDAKSKIKIALAMLKNHGILIANCEIYNWQGLDKKYNLNAKNDADLLLKFLDEFKLEKLNELDG